MDSAQARTLLGDLTDQEQLLAQEVNFAARSGDHAAMAEAAEKLLRIQPRVAEAYRTWLARTERLAPLAEGSASL